MRLVLFLLAVMMGGAAGAAGAAAGRGRGSAVEARKRRPTSKRRGGDSWIMDSWARCSNPSAAYYGFVDLDKKTLNNIDRKICYISVGTVEMWRTDYRSIPDAVVGDWVYPDERIINVNYWDNSRLLAAMGTRLDRSKEAGCWGVEFDNTDCWSMGSACDGSRDAQIQYIGWLSRASRRKGLATGCKNVVHIIEDVDEYCDFYVAEDCGHCSEYNTSKMLFVVNYSKSCGGNNYCKECGGQVFAYK